MEQCLFCFFTAAAARALTRARALDAERLPSLAAPWHKTAAEMDRLAYGEKRCSCGKPGAVEQPQNS